MATQYVNCAVVGLLCLITSGAAAQPPIPIWGGSLAYQVLVEMTNYADSPDNPRWSFNYYYLVNGSDCFEIQIKYIPIDYLYYTHMMDLTLQSPPILCSDEIIVNLSYLSTY
tara:strand:+ start:197 stop:532 length:336 start_codon:yes stop_codon:yes gene_type:complete